MWLHAWFGHIFPNRNKRYCGPEGPEIDGQTKMAKNGRYSTGGSLLSLLVVVAVSFWPFNNLCHRDGNGIRACILAITVYFFWLNYIIYCLSVINNKRLSLECIIIFCQKKDLLDQAGYLIDFCVLFFCPTTIVSLSSPLAPPCFCPDFYIRKKVHYEDARK